MYPGKNPIGLLIFLMGTVVCFSLMAFPGCSGGGGGGDAPVASESTGTDEDTDADENTGDQNVSAIPLGDYTGTLDIRYQVVVNAAAADFAEAAIPASVMISEPIHISDAIESNPFHIVITPQESGVYGYLQIQSAGIAPPTIENPRSGVIEFWRYRMKDETTFEGSYLKPVTNPLDNYLLSAEYNGAMSFNSWTVCQAVIQKGAVITGTFENGQLLVKIDGKGDGCALGSVLEFHATISAAQ